MSMNKQKTAVVTGITGQDGSYLAELLVEKGYEVIGVARRSSMDNHYARLDGVMGTDSFKLVIGDVTDAGNMLSIVNDYQPDELYNLAAQSFVKVAFDQPSYTWQVNAQGVLNILEAIRKSSPHTKMYQASTSEMFGRSYSTAVPKGDGNHMVQHFDMDNTPPHTLIEGCTTPYQNEHTPFQPQSPYSIGKAAAHYAMQLYRRTYDLHLSCGILFNHESERRGKQFVTRKITDWAARFCLWRKQYLDQDDVIFQSQRGSENPIQALYVVSPKDCRVVSTFPKLRLGNLDSKRDWGHTEDYVRAMWMMLQQDKPDDYVVSTQQNNSVGDFVSASLEAIGLRNADPLDYVYQDPEFMRPAEVSYLLGDSRKIRSTLGWYNEIPFKGLVKRMVDNDIKENA